MGGSSSKQTIGYRYLLGVHMGLAHGPLDRILEIQVDRRVAWDIGTTGGTISIDAPQLFGGDKREGGISGTVDVEMGGPTQTQNAYLQSQLGDDIPAFRGVACLVLNQVYMGNNPYLKPWAVKAMRTDVTSYAVEQWNVDEASIFRPGEDDAETLVGDYDTLLFASKPVNQDAVFPLASGWDAPTTTDWGQQGFNCVETNQPPFTSAYGDSRAFVVTDTDGASDNYFQNNSDDSTAPFHSGLVIFAPIGSAEVLSDMTIASKTVTFVFDSGPNLDRTFPIHMDGGIDVDTGNNRARFSARVYDTGLSGSTTIYSDYFDFDAGSDDVNKWKVFQWEFRMHGFENELYAVNPSLNRNRVRFDNNFSLCMTHYFNGERRQDSWVYSVRAIGSTGWSSATTNYRFQESQKLRAMGGLAALPNGTWEVAHLGPATAVLGGGSPEGFGVANCSTFEVYSPDAGECADMNPAHIIRECLTNQDWGMGYATGDIDSTSFESASSTLFTEGMGISILWDREIPLEDFIGEILRHIDGVLFCSRETGKFVLKLIREETPTVTLDETNVSTVSNAKRPTIAELTNSVTVVFWDCTKDEDASVSLHNEALRQVQGVGISNTIQYPGFTNRAMAQRIAQRDLQALSTPLLSCEIVANREAVDINIGDAFTLNWPDLNISSLVMRANEIDYGDGIDNAVKIIAVEDVFATPTNTPLVEPSEEWVDPIDSTPLDATARIVTETPYYPLVLEVGQAQINDTLTADNGAGYLLVSAGRQGSETNADLQVDSGGGYESVGTVDFHPYATLDGAIGKTDTVLAITTPVDLSEVETGTIAQIGEELVRVDAVTESSPIGSYVSVTVGRGILDTTPKEHADGAVISFWGEFATSDDIQYADAESVDVKLFTTLGPNILAAPPVDSVTFNSRAIRPYPPGNFRIDTSPETTNWTGDHTFTWAHRDRLQQTDGTLYDHYDSSIGPEDGVTYRIEGYAYGGSPEVETQFINVTLSGSPLETTWTYNAAAVAGSPDVAQDPPGDTERVVIRIYSVRGGYDSWQPAEISMPVGSPFL